MRRLKLAVAALFTVATIVSVSAQDSNNPWVVGFGVNAVDIRTSTESSDNGMYCRLFLEFLQRNT